MYVKTIRKGADDFGYVLFSNDSMMNLSKSISALVFSTFVLKTKDDKYIGLYSNGNIMEVNQVKYKFKREITETDTAYYEKKIWRNILGISLFLE